MDCFRRYGFSLVEALIVLSILSIVLSLGAPGFLNLVRSNLLVTQTNHFVVAANLARSEAIKRNSRTVICPKADELCSVEDNWEAGWIVFEDRDGNLSPGASEIIRIFEPLADGYRLKPNVKTLSLLYYGDGHVRRRSNALPMASFALCAPDAKPGNLTERSREIVISETGRMRLQVGREDKTKC